MQSFPKDTRLCQSHYTPRRTWAATIFEPIPENLHRPPFVIALWSNPNKKLQIFLRSIKIVSVTVKVTSKRKFEDRRSEETILEDKALLFLVRKWKFYLMIQMSWAQQCRVKCIYSVGGHYHLQIDCLIKTIHLTADTFNFIMQAQFFFCWKQASTSGQTDPRSDSASWMHVNAETEKEVQDNTSWNTDKQTSFQILRQRGLTYNTNC